MNSELKNSLSSYPSFKAPFWCRGGHLQTLCGHFLDPNQLQDGFERKIISTHDGDDLISFLYRGQSDKIITLFHGLSGNTDSNYMIRLGNLLSSKGHSVLLVNHRGAHPVSPSSKGIYHSGRSEDLSSVFQWVRSEFSDLKIIAMGFSMSANILLLNVAGVRSEFQPDFAVAVNAPLNLDQVCRSLDSGFNRIYGLNFTRELMKQHHLDKWLPTVRQFDEEYTAPLAGYTSAMDYYQNCSAELHIQKIKTPTVVLTTKDDPFISSKLFENLKWPESVLLRIENQGGHLGYLQKTKSGTNRWLDEYLGFIADRV